MHKTEKMVKHTLNPIQDGHFRGCLRMGGQKGHPP